MCQQSMPTSQITFYIPSLHSPLPKVKKILYVGNIWNPLRSRSHVKPLFQLPSSFSQSAYSYHHYPLGTFIKMWIHAITTGRWAEAKMSQDHICRHKPCTTTILTKLFVALPNLSAHVLY